MIAPFALLVFAAPCQVADTVATPRETALTCRVEERDGARILFLSGTCEERGFGEGRLLCDDIVGCFEEFALPYVTGGSPARWDAVIRPGAKLFHVPAETKRWAEALVRGMEAARGGPVDIESLGRAIDAVDVLTWSAVPDLAGFACSSLAVWGRASESGDVLVGRNLDYSSSPLVRKNSIVEVHAPMAATDESPAKAGWVGMGWPGTYGCLTGLNEHGVFVAIHDVSGGDVRIGLRYQTRMLALSRLLETGRPDAALPETFAKSLRKLPFAMGGNFMVAWQSPDGEKGSRGAAVVEVGTDAAEGGATARRANDGETWIACSNDHYAREGEEPSCRRYRTLRNGALGTAKGAGLKAADLWRLVDAAGMRITLYRCVADLGRRTLTVQRKTDTGWAVRESLSVAALLQ